MSFPITHSTEQKIDSLSERLKYLAKNDNSYKNYIDQTVKSENLKFNLSLVISHIILNLDFIDRSPEVFREIITEYNQGNKTTLTFEDFEDADLIRILAKEVLMPEVVRHFIWQVGYYEKEGKPIQIPPGKRDLILCLRKYYENCFEDARLTISLEKLNGIIRRFGSPRLSLSYFEQTETLKYDPKGHFYWLGGEYTRHLRNEIASTLWLLITETQATITEFRRYNKLISMAGIWIDDLGSYLSHEHTSKICEFAVAFLNSEPDLLRSDKEFTKIWLDANTYQHVNINTPVPILEFNYENTYDFIESVNYHKWRFRDAFDYQSTRSFCYSLLRLIVANDTKHPKKYENALMIIKDTTRPFLLWTLYQEIKREFPFVIPHMLNDPELIPIAFRLVDKIDINKDILSERSSNEELIKESQEIKNQLWMEMFEFVLERLALNRDQGKQNAWLLARIFIDTAENVFRINTSNRTSATYHHLLRSRYEETLKKLCSVRLRIENVYPVPPVNPRLIFLLLPDALNYFEKIISDQKIPHTEFISIETGIIDISIEFLRLASIPIIQNEISEDQKRSIQKASTDLTLALQKKLLQFYSVTEIDVRAYDSGGVKKRKVRRGINEFGFEIIDWGYLFLNFEKADVLNDLQSGFTASLSFNVGGNKDEETNQNQFEKIELYLKSLMLAFYSINQKLNLYETEQLPAKETLKKLEGWIKEFSLKYSVDDTQNMRIDVFDERFSIVGYDEYHQQLTSLLYRCVNYFQPPTQIKFVEDLLIENDDTGRLLTAINILDSKQLRDLISSKCSLDKTNQFIDETSTVTELQNAMIEAVNSSENWNLTRPLLKRVEQHYNSIQHFDENALNIIFEVKLLLAFKEKNLTELEAVTVPTLAYDRRPSLQKKENRKNYLVALHLLYHESKYSEAILKLESLHSMEETKIDYAFHLLRAKTLKAVSEKATLPYDALNSWGEFVSQLKGDNQKLLVDFDESLEHNYIHYHIANDDFAQFETAISKLTDKFLYDEEILFKVFDYYLKRHLEDLALKYLKDAEQYFLESGKLFPEKLKAAITGGEKTDIIKVKSSLEKLLGFKPTTLIAALPSVHNGETDLNTFILIEVIHGLKGLVDKKTSIKNLTEENELNDVLQVAIKARLALWGWSIPDQSRAGRSQNGRGAGELDFVIEAGGKKIALIEALVLKSKEQGKTQRHVLKVFDYVDYLQRYYMIIYFKGPIGNFDHTWAEYKLDVLDVKFPSSLEIDAAKGFQDISNIQEDVRQIKISKTIHNSDVELFHVMVNLSV